MAGVRGNSGTFLVKKGVKSQKTVYKFCSFFQSEYNMSRKSVLQVALLRLFFPYAKIEKVGMLDEVIS